MSSEQSLSESHPEIIQDAYRERRMARDHAAAEVLARQAFQMGLLHPRDMVTGKKRSYPLRDAEFDRWLTHQDRRWRRWLAHPGAIRPPRISDDGERLAGF